MNDVLSDTKLLMRKYKIKANKNLGQNFLIDDKVLEDIVDGAMVTKDELVIEIGPGLGNLTKLLLEKSKKVICVELDKRMIKILQDRFIAYNNIEIINNDILKVNLKEIISKERDVKSIKVIANLPYYITTPIIMKLIEEDLNIDSITVMVQKEVAERLIAKTGTKNSGAITYTVEYYCECQKIREVSNECFIPEPEVTSEVIKLTLRKNNFISVRDKKVMFNIIKSAFMQRRKTLINSLTNVGVFKTKEQGEEALKNLGIREDARPETLCLEDFARLANYFLNNIK